MPTVFCAGLALTALTSLTAAPICIDNEPYSSGFAIANHNQKVTVRDGNDKGNVTPLFSQKIDTPNLTVVETTLAGKSTRISLLDGKGKVIWTKTLSYAVPATRMAQGDKFSTTTDKLLSTTFTNYLLSHHITQKSSHLVRTEAVIGPEDKMLSMNINFVDGKNRHMLSVHRLSAAITARIDSEPPVTVQLPVPPGP